MNARILALLVLSTATAVGCTPGDAQSGPRPDPHAPAPALAPAQPAATPIAPVPRTAPDPDSERATIYNVSLSLVVDDPGRSLERAEEVLRKLGGEVTYASSNGDNANLNGRIPVEARHRLRDALAQLGGTIQSENMSASDISHEVRRLRRRLVSIQRADAQITSLFAGQEDTAQIEAAALMRELTDRERQSVDAQLESYRTQTRDGQVNVSFTRPTPQATR